MHALKLGMHFRVDLTSEYILLIGNNHIDYFQFQMFSARTSILTRLAFRNFRSLRLTKTMPFTELAFPKLKMGLEVREAFAETWPLSAKVLASQPTISRAFFGSVISENGVPSTREENKPIIVIGRRRSSRQTIYS